MSKIKLWLKKTLNFTFLLFVLIAIGCVIVGMQNPLYNIFFYLMAGISLFICYVNVITANSAATSITYKNPKKTN